MRRVIFGIASLLWLAGAYVTAGAAQGNRSTSPVQTPAAASPVQSLPPSQGSPAVSTQESRALLDRYCVTCHNQRAKTAGLMLDQMDVTGLPEHAETWEKVIKKLRVGAMPPQGMPRPDGTTLDRFTTWLEASLDAAATASPNPGRTMIHRLNRAEYRNAVRDLLDIDVDVAALLPADSSSFGFDNVADVLKTSPLLLERYLTAALRISEMAIGDMSTLPGGQIFKVPLTKNQNEQVEGLPAGTRGGTLVNYHFPLDGEYVLKATLFRVNSGGLRGVQDHEEPLTYEILVDGVPVHTAPIGGKEDDALSAVNRGAAMKAIEPRLQTRVFVKAGPHAVGFTFQQPDFSYVQAVFQTFRPSSQDPGEAQGLPQIDSVSIQGPFNPTGTGDTPSRRRVLICTPATAAEEDPCARRILSTLARRAYRRPVSGAELDGLMRWYERGRNGRGSFEAGIRTALPRILTSPSFLFRANADPDGVAAGSPYKLDDIALASRLSFFLWSSIPDDELLDLAIRGRLRQPGVLEAQVRRMLADRRSDEMVNNFIGQWLFLRNLRTTLPDHTEFPEFDEDLRNAMEKETQLFVSSIVHEDRSVISLLNADYTFLNESLARHYGIRGVYGSQFRRVTLADDFRRGLLGQGSILTLTSAQTKTSPVKRGKWVLTNILNTPPPDPPPNVPALPEAKTGDAPRTMRALMEQHRANPVCSACHRNFDPIGFALENFNAVGQWRTSDAGAPIDASATLNDGTNIAGPAALRQALLARGDVFVGTVTEKLLTYALGRGLEPQDMAVVRSIVRRAKADDYRFSAIVLGIAQSTPFSMKLKAAPAPTASGVQAQR